MEWSTKLLCLDWTQRTNSSRWWESQKSSVETSHLTWPSTAILIPCLQSSSRLWSHSFQIKCKIPCYPKRALSTNEHPMSFSPQPKGDAPHLVSVWRPACYKWCNSCSSGPECVSVSSHQTVISLSMLILLLGLSLVHMHPFQLHFFVHLTFYK